MSKMDGSCGCGTGTAVIMRNCALPRDSEARVDLPAYVVDSCLDVRVKPTDSYKVLGDLAESHISDALRLASNQPIVGSANFNGPAPALISLAAAVGDKQEIAGVVIELVTAGVGQPGDLTFEVLFTSKTQNAQLSTGTFRIQQKANGRARIVVFFYARAGNSLTTYPKLATLETSYTIATVPANAFGQNVPAAPTALLGTDSQIVLSASAGTIGQGVIMSTLSAQDDIWNAAIAALRGA